MSTSVSSPPPTSSRQSKADTSHPSWPASRYWIIFGATLLILIVLFFVIRSQGRVEGVEFAPSHFQTRSFSFYEIPFLHLQITPIKRKINVSNTAKFLIAKNLIQPAKTAPNTWHLASLSRGLSGNKLQDASFLTTQLSLAHRSKSFWETWSDEHPQNAKIAWPVVQKLAQRELYLTLPGLFELLAGSPKVETDAESKALQSQIDDYLKTQYAGLITDMDQAGRKPLAAELLAEALADYPDDPALASITIHVDRATEEKPLEAAD